MMQKTDSYRFEPVARIWCSAVNTIFGLSRVYRLLQILSTASLLCIPGVVAVSGCAQAAAEGSPTNIQVGGKPRGLITVIPEKYDSTQRHRLIIAFHGRTNPAVRVRGYYDLERYAKTPTIFVYPRGVADAQGRFSWWVPGEGANELRAYALFDAIRARFMQDYCIGEIFLVGHSLGASIVNNLGCARGEFIRAIATVAGGTRRLTCSGLVAAMLIHNPDDRLVSIRFGRSARDHFLAYGGYTGTPQPEEFMGVGCVRHAEITGGFPLLWCLSDQDTTHRGRYYSHQWPSGTGQWVMAFARAG